MTPIFYLPEAKIDRFATFYGPNPDDNNRMMLTEVGDANSRYVAEPTTFFSGAENGGADIRQSHR